jgi:hypothetical protein
MSCGSKVGPLTPEQAAGSLVGRLVGTSDRRGLVDRARQIATRLGTRPLRVFLVWTRWDGEERGEGHEREIAREELLPTPKVSDLTSLALSPFSAGKLPVGSVRVSEISATYPVDRLLGTTLPPTNPPLDHPIDKLTTFFVEIIGDGRHGERPGEERRRFRVLGTPSPAVSGTQWEMLLERAGEDRTRAGIPGIDVKE